MFYDVVVVVHCFCFIGEDATAAKSSSSASTSLVTPSVLMAGFTPKAEEESESEASDGHDDITTNNIIEAIKASEARIIAEVRRTTQLTKVKSFTFEDDTTYDAIAEGSSTSDI